MWLDRHGRPKAAATGAFAAGTSKKPQGKGKRWRAYYVGSDGIRKYQSFSLKDEAEAWVKNRCAEVNEGRWVNPSMGTGTFGEIAGRWFATQAVTIGADGKSRGPLAPSTHTDYEGLLRLYIVPRWGATSIRDINYADLVAWYAQLGADGSQKGTALGASRIRRISIVMGLVFKYAMKAGLVQNDPTVLIERRKELPRLPQPKKNVALAHAELWALADEMGDLGVMTLVLGYCGLRIGEAVALRRKNIVGQALHVEEATAFASGYGVHETDTKSHRRRTVPIPEPIWRLLKPTLPSDSDAYVFPFNGVQMRDFNYSHRFKKAVKATQERMNKQRESEIADTGEATTREFPQITPHDLRDTFASLAIQAGANIKVLQKLMGHASAAVTLDTYADYFPEDIDTVAQALGAAIRLQANRPLEEVGIVSLRGPEEPGGGR